MTTGVAALDVRLPAGERITNGKLAMWLFLASEVMFFAGLIGTYIVLRVSDPMEFKPARAEELGSKLNKYLAGANTLVLIVSSFTMAMAVNSARLKDNKKVRLFLLLTALLGRPLFSRGDRLARASGRPWRSLRP